MRTTELVARYLEEIRGISKDNICPKCGGIGERTYSSTSTWRGGIAGQMLTDGICDTCWGSGDATRPWTNLRVLYKIMTKEQLDEYYKIIGGDDK